MQMTSLKLRSVTPSLREISTMNRIKSGEESSRRSASPNYLKVIQDFRQNEQIRKFTNPIIVGKDDECEFANLCNTS